MIALLPRRAALALAALALGVLAPAAAAADPLVPQQDWLARALPASLPAPAGPIPPIAIIETGVDATHPDMAGGWVSQRRAAPAPDPSDAGAVSRHEEGIAHGTAVASVIGAPRNGVGMEGVLPGATVWVYGSSGRCRDDAAAIRQAVRDGAKVINASYGYTRAGACREHRDATSLAFGSGVLVVAAAGNMRSQPWIQPGNDLHVLTASALTARDQPAGFSHQGVHSDISAPGEGILLAVPAGADRDGTPDGYTRWDGTSFAAPIVAAAAARVLADRPDLSADQLAELLRRSARDLGRPSWDISTGWGALDLGAALAERPPRHDPYEPNDDIRWVDGRAGFRADPPLARRAPRALVEARLDALKDPFDVYPVWVPARGSVAIRLTPRAIGADLYAWRPEARTAYGAEGRVIAKGRRPGLAVETLRIDNAGATGARIWVEVRAVRGRSLAGSYRLGVLRS